MAFHQIRFPTDIGLGARGGPKRVTDIVTLASGAEERNQRWANSVRTYDASFGVKTRADADAVLNFFEERRGRFHSFLWRDAMDHASAPVGTGISPLDQQIAIGDGVQTQFQLVKTYGSQFDPYQRRVTKPVAATVRIAVDGTELSGAQFSVDDLTGMITLQTPPEAGGALTAGYEFDTHVRFDRDELMIELIDFNAALVPSIPVIEVL